MQMVRNLAVGLIHRGISVHMKWCLKRVSFQVLTKNKPIFPFEILGQLGIVEGSNKSISECVHTSSRTSGIKSWNACDVLDGLYVQRSGASTRGLTNALALCLHVALQVNAGLTWKCENIKRKSLTICHIRLPRWHRISVEFSILARKCCETAALHVVCERHVARLLSPV